MKTCKLTMEELDRIIDQFYRSFDGKAWQGSSVLKLLSDIKAIEALARPLISRHTIIGTGSPHHRRERCCN